MVLRGRSLPALAVGLAGVYGIAALTRNAGGDAACRPAVDIGQRKLAPLAHGEVAAVNVAKSPLRVPDLAFRTHGQAADLADWRGRTVLLNLWATWCVPCRKEMPALDALEQKLGGPDFEVVAVNIDTRDADKPKAWLKDVGVEKLAYYRRSERQGIPGSQRRSAALSACRPRC